MYSSPLPPDVSNCAVLFILVFCQAVKTFTAHFVLYLVFLGAVSDSKEISSSSVFSGENVLLPYWRFGSEWKFWIFLLLSHALSPVGRTAFWHPCHKTILCIQFIVFLSQVGENICVRCVWHSRMHVQWTNPITILCIQFNVFISQVG